jgi:2-polyprenyl-6-hydroxyphenyl methylase / 3-demethylubiquinone-9 3-methyltransferase
MSNSNLDPAEISKFSSLADTWWDAKGPLRSLHEINPARLAFIKSQISLAQQQIVDLGCGGGILSEALAREQAQVFGVDQSEALIDIATTHACSQNLPITYQVAEIEAFSQERSEAFDAVCCMELLEHVPNPSVLIQACHALVKPRGWVFFSTINRNLPAYLLAIFGAEYCFNIVPKGTHTYEKFIRPSELSAAARQAGLRLVKLQGLHYNPFSHQASLSSSVQINYLAAFQKEA